MKKLRILSLLLILAVVFGALSLSSCDGLMSALEDGEISLPLGDKNEGSTSLPTEDKDGGEANTPSGDLDSIPKYDGKSAYVIINGNKPFFEESEYTTKSYESYGDLDSLGRCTVTMACVGRDIMPAEDEERGSISSVYPTGWEQNRYDAELVEGGWLYNRAHLIGWQLTAENANRENLITGTRYFNVDGMLPFENMVADYVRETGDHVLYRVTPIFEGDNLLASGVLMEARSMEDDGEGVEFCVYVYNVQPGIEIDYATGENKLAE